MSPRRSVSLLSPRRSFAFIVPEGRWYSILVLSPLCCLLPLCCCLMSRLCFHLFFSCETNMFFLRLHQLTVAASSRGERRATGRSPHMKTQQCGTEQDGTRRSPRPVGGDDKNLHVVPADSKRVTEQMPAGTILAQKACRLEAAGDRMPIPLSLLVAPRLGSCPPQSAASSRGRRV